MLLIGLLYKACNQYDVALILSCTYFSRTQYYDFYVHLSCLLPPLHRSTSRVGCQHMTLLALTGILCLCKVIF
jgi:hypothetical protein